MKMNILYYKRMLFLALAGLAFSAAQPAQQQEGAPAEGEETSISQACAAFMASGGILGAGAAITYFPMALCTVGFCPVGVTGGSAAALVQSTLPLITKGSVFAALQSAAATGTIGTKITVSAAAIGGALGLQLCAYIDDQVKSGTTTGLAFQSNAEAWKATLSAGGTLSKACYDSDTCAAAISGAKQIGTTVASNAISGAKQIGSTVASNAAYYWKRAKTETRRIILESQIESLDSDLKMLARLFGEEIYDLIEKEFSASGPPSPLMASNKFKTCHTKVKNFRKLINQEMHRNKESSKDQIINYEKAIVIAKGDCGLPLLKWLRDTGGEDATIIVKEKVVACVEKSKLIVKQIEEKKTAIDELDFGVTIF